jgi:hypothetical protein
LGQSQTRYLPTILPPSLFTPCLNGTPFLLPDDGVINGNMTLLVDIEFVAFSEYEEEEEEEGGEDAYLLSSSNNISYVISKNRYWIAIRSSDAEVLHPASSTSPTSPTSPSSTTASSSTTTTTTTTISSVVAAPLYTDVAALRYDNDWVTVSANGTFHVDAEENVVVSLEIFNGNTNDDGGEGNSKVAFYVTLDLICLSCTEAIDLRVLPTFWNDNHFWLLPGESKLLTATAPRHALLSKGKDVLDKVTTTSTNSSSFGVEVSGWNVKEMMLKLSPQ